VMVSADGGRDSSLVGVREESFVEGSEIWCLRSSLFTALGRGRPPASGDGKTPAGNTVNEDISTLKGEDGGRDSSLVGVREESFVEGSEIWCLRSS
jgi:hypothetical protein